MANWTTLKTAIANVIKTNGNQEITGRLLQNVLNNMVSSVGENATFVGIATPTTNPGVPDGPVFYIATTVGVYANFDGIELKSGEAVILQWNGGAWKKKITRLATEQEIIYDVSARNGGVVFKSLSALFNSPNLGALIPASVRHGGMSIRFIQGSEQSSDNNYVQARLIAQSFTTNITKWQSVDEEPKVGSHNLVESGGVLIKNNVLHYTSPIDSAIWGDKLDISNIPNGTIIYFTIKHTYPVNTGSAGFGIYSYNATTLSSTKLASLTVGTISQIVKTDSISTIYLYIAPTSQAGDVALFMGVDKELLIENVVELYSLSSLTKKGYLYKGYATPSTNPNVVSGEKVFYIAAKRGNYVNFNNINVPFTYNTYILKYDGSSWSYDVVENIKYDSKFSSCYIVNQLIKELYVVKQPQAFTNALYVRQIINGTNGVWRISFNQVGSTTGSYNFDFDEKTNGLIHLSKGELEIYAVLDWSAILNNSTFTFTDTETVLRNEKNVEFSPTIELAIKNYDNQIAQIHNLNQRQYIRILSLGLNAFIPIQYGFIGANGKYVSNDDFYISDFIPVSEGNKVYFTGKYNTTSALGAVWGYTDENYSNPIMILGWTQATFENEEITIPASVNFIKAWSRKDIQPILSFINSAPEPSEYNVTVKKDGTGDFTSIVDAVRAVTDTSKPNNIHIYPGTYDMISEYFGDSDYTDTSDVGLVLPNNVNLIGCGKKENVIIEANFPSTIKYNTSNHFSPIYLRGRNNKLQNLTVQCFNCRYPVHDQAASNDNKEYLHEYVDVILIHNGFDSGAIVTTESVTEENNDTSHRWGSCHALGQGTYKTATIICERCEFICNAAGGVPYLTHDAQEHLEQGVTILLSECKLVSTRNGDIMIISSLGEGYSNSMTLRNCKFISANKSIVGKIHTPGTEFVYTIYGNKENGVTINLPTGYEDNDWTI